MIHVIATITLKPGSRTEFLEVFNANVPAVLAEEGCRQYVPTIDADSGIEGQDTNENTVVVIEQWESIEALKAHLVAPHMVAFRERAGHLIDDLSLKILNQG